VGGCDVLCSYGVMRRKQTKCEAADPIVRSSVTQRVVVAF
jgi:hypothetical protein